VTMLFDERVYGILALRYKELPKGGSGGGGGGGGEVPFDIDPHLTEIETGIINADYINSKFQRYVKCLEQKNVTAEELASVKDELHTTFAALSQEDQKFAQMLIDDLASGSITLEPGLTISDYITQYKTKALNRDIELAVRAFGLDKALLVEMLSGGSIDEGNLNTFGRFDKLLRSVDRTKAKAYLEAAMETSLTTFQFNARLNTVLREFLFSGGKGEKIPAVRIESETKGGVLDVGFGVEYAKPGDEALLAASKQVKYEDEKE